MSKKELNKKFYEERKWSNRCVRCGIELEDSYLSNECELCKLKSRVSGMDARLKRIEKFIDNYLKDKEIDTDGGKNDKKMY